MYQKNKNKAFGFTLIELMISLSIFTIVVLIAVGALLNLSHVNDRSQALLTALENLDFAIEHMSRTIRTGVKYDCDGGFPTPSATDCVVQGSSIFSFEDQNENAIRFQLFDGGVVRERELPGGIFEPALKITAPEIIIEDLKFYVVGTDTFAEGDLHQPRVLITLRGTTNIAGLKPNEQADFDLQTSISQRQPDE